MATNKLPQNSIQNSFSVPADVLDTIENVLFKTETIFAHIERLLTEGKAGEPIDNALLEVLAHSGYELSCAAMAQLDDSGATAYNRTWNEQGLTQSENTSH